MLKNVLKYDLKFTYKLLGVFYIITLIAALLTRIFFSFSSSTILEVLGYICSGVTVSFIFNILLNNMMRLWIRFTNNVYKDESYLTHTLPISKKTIYLSKFLASVITMFTSALVILFAVFIAYYSKENMEALKNSITFLASVYNTTAIKLILIILFVFFLEMTFAIQIGYTGIILGHKANNNKAVKSILYGGICYLLTQAFTLLFVYIFGLFNPGIMNLFMTMDQVDVNSIKMVMYMAIGVYFIYLLIYYLVNVKLFSKGVNVE